MPARQFIVEYETWYKESHGGRDEIWKEDANSVTVFTSESLSCDLNDAVNEFVELERDWCFKVVPVQIAYAMFDGANGYRFVPVTREQITTSVWKVEY